MFRLTLKKLFTFQSKLTNARRPMRFAPGVESLEARTVPTTLTVGMGEEYPTITAALAAAKKNDTIDVYNGTYNEAVIVDTAGIHLMAVGSDVVVQPTTVALTSSESEIGGAAIDIYAANVVVQGFTVDGSMDSDGNLFVGIRVIDGGSATIEKNTVTGILYASNPTSDVGIDVGVSQISGMGGKGTATVEYNTIENYLGAGVLVDGSGATATVEGNTITGRATANNGVPQYGVQVSNNAVATVEANTISNNTVSGYVFGGDNPSPASAGIYFLHDSVSSVAKSNTISANDDGILVEQSDGTSSKAVSISGNSVTHNFGYAGIEVLSSNYITVTKNDVNGNNTENGIATNYSQEDTISHNDVFNNEFADGIYDYEGTSNQILSNDSFSNGNNGINVDSCTNDLISGNSALTNVYNGIQIINGSGNTVKGGDCVENTLSGIVLVDTTGNTVSKVTMSSNSVYGIQLQDAQDTMILNDTFISNSEGAIYIDSNSFGTVLKGD